MTQPPDPSLPSLANKSSWFNTFYENNKTWLDRVLILVITGILGTVFHIKLDEVKQITNDTKDVTVNTNQTQKAVAEGTKELVVNQIGPQAKALAPLEATTQSIVEPAK